MGQKTHPNGFRVGVSKKHDAVWFSDYKAYANILEEDYKIRSLFKKKFEPVYVEAGIVKLKIQRKILQLELFIYVTPKKDGNSDLQNLAVELKKNLESLFSHNEKIRIIILETKRIESYLIAKAISDQLEKRVRPAKALYGGVRIAEENNVSGFKIQLKGRLSGGPKSKTRVIRKGRVPLQTIKEDVRYALCEARTTHGIIGVKVWLFYSE
jgi:small subunit ribosomal protein S3